MNKETEDRLIKEYKFHKAFGDDPESPWLEKKLKQFNDLKVKFTIDYDYEKKYDVIIVELISTKDSKWRPLTMEFDYKFSWLNLQYLLKSWTK